MDKFRSGLDKLSGGVDRRVDKFRSGLDKLSGRVDRRVDKFRSGLDKLSGGVDRRVDKFRSGLDKLSGGVDRQVDKVSSATNIDRGVSFSKNGNKALLKKGFWMLRALIGMTMGLLVVVVGCTTPGSESGGSESSPSPTPSVASGSPTPLGVSESSGDQQPVRLEKTVIKTKQGQRWEMEADSVDWMDDSSKAKAEVVTWFLLDPKGERTVRVDSAGADVDMKAEVVVFTGEVEARRLDSDESLDVQHLVYNGKKRTFHGSEGVLWKREGMELSGETLTATAELDKVQLKGRVRGKSDGKGFSAGGTPSPAQVDR